MTVDIAIFAVFTYLTMMPLFYLSEHIFPLKDGIPSIKEWQGSFFRKEMYRIVLEYFLSHFFVLVFGGSQIRAFPSKLMFETLMYANIMLFIYTSVHMSVVCLHSVSDPKMSDFYSVFFRFNEMDIKYEYIQLMYIYT